MGLDAYFYKKPKVVKQPEPVTAEMLSEAFESQRLKDALTKLQQWATENDYTFEQALYQAVDHFNDARDGYDTYRCEVLYFRKFHYLLGFFHYGDEEYGKDIVVTREQCEELLKRAEKCLIKVDKYLKKQNCASGEYDYESGVLLSFTLNGDLKTESRICEHVNKLTNEAFPCACEDSYIDHISRLFVGMRDIVNDTDWDNYDIVFNADW